MNEGNPPSIPRPRRPAWNKGKCLARCRHCGQITFGRFARCCNLRNARVTWRCLVWPSTAKLRVGCDLVALHVDDVALNGYAIDRRLSKTG